MQFIQVLIFYTTVDHLQTDHTEDAIRVVKAMRQLSLDSSTSITRNNADPRIKPCETPCVIDSILDIFFSHFYPFLLHIVAYQVSTPNGM